MSAPVVAAFLQKAAAHGELPLTGCSDDSGTAPGPAAAVGAVRLLGADALAPHVLAGQALVPEESAAVRLALSALPPAQRPPAAPPHGPEAPWTRAWIDWGLVAVLTRLDSAAFRAPAPAAPPPCDGNAPRRHSAAGADAHHCGESGEGWIPWSLRMGQLASLALPGLDSSVHDAARSHALALARGATRSLLRRDFPTAARITRWLAWLAAGGATLPLDVTLLTQDIALRGGGERCLLDVAISRRLLGLDSE
ncbi:hypothetical protein [Streptomyces sp. NPDC088760]|uniref:hypothetical protein n=1 Tax=Streptomyces sp. NPDC088760 TaxID=3365890 RepID=UPI00381BBE23